MKPIHIFLLSFVVIAAILFLFPINLFDGEIEYQKQLVNVVEQRPLSLSYFIGLGYDPADMDVIKSFRLLPGGYLLAAIMLFGFPALIAYRIHLKRSSKDNS